MRTETIFRALADPTRLRIMRLLGSMELAVGEVAQVLGQSQPRVSRHIGILCDAGLAERRREGSWIYLRAATEAAQGSPLTAAVARLLSPAPVLSSALWVSNRSDAVRRASAIGRGSFCSSFPGSFDKISNKERESLKRLAQT